MLNLTNILILTLGQWGGMGPPTDRDQMDLMRALEFYDQLYNADMARYRSREDQGKLRSSLQICGPSPPLYSL